MAPGSAEGRFHGGYQPLQHEEHQDYTQHPSSPELSFIPTMHLQAAMQAANAAGHVGNSSPHGLPGLTLNLGHDAGGGGGGRPPPPSPGHPSHIDALMSELQAQAGLTHEQVGARDLVLSGFV
jgi:hypothetical protein